MLHEHRQLHKNKIYLQVNVVKDIKTRSNASNYELDTPLPREKNKMKNNEMRDKLGGK